VVEERYATNKMNQTRDFKKWLFEEKYIHLPFGLPKSYIANSAGRRNFPLY